MFNNAFQKSGVLRCAATLFSESVSTPLRRAEVASAQFPHSEATPAHPRCPEAACAQRQYPEAASGQQRSPEAVSAQLSHSEADSTPSRHAEAASGQSPDSAAGQRLSPEATDAQLRFCEGIVAGLRCGEAYAAAFPGVERCTRWSGGTRLLAMPAVRAEIARLRAVADEAEGSAVLTLVERRKFLARVVRARPGMLEEESELWQKVRTTGKGVRLRLPDKLGAIKLDNALAGKNGKENEEIRRQEESILEFNRNSRESYAEWKAKFAEMMKSSEMMNCGGYWMGKGKGNGEGMGESRECSTADAGAAGRTPHDGNSGDTESVGAQEAAEQGGTTAGYFCEEKATGRPAAVSYFHDEKTNFVHQAVPLPCGGTPAEYRRGIPRTWTEEPRICYNAARRPRKERLVINAPSDEPDDPSNEDSARETAGADSRLTTKNSQLTKGPQRKFCEGIVAGLSATDAYAAAYPRATRRSARSAGSAMLTRGHIREEIEGLRKKAAELAGGEVLSVEEKRRFLARVVNARPARLGEDSDLWQSVTRSDTGVELVLPDKIRALAIDDELAGDEKVESQIVKDFHEMIVRVRTGRGMSEMRE